MMQMLAMVGKEKHYIFDVQLPHVEFGYNNYVSITTGLSPNENIMVARPARCSQYPSHLS